MRYTLPRYNLFGVSVSEALLLVEARTYASTGQAVAIRQAAGLSQGEIARAIGTTRSSISRWEAKLRRPSGPPAIAWARLLRELAKRER